MLKMFFKYKFLNQLKIDKKMLNMLKIIKKKMKKTMVLGTWNQSLLKRLQKMKMKKPVLIIKFQQIKRMDFKIIKIVILKNQINKIKMLILMIIIIIIIIIMMIMKKKYKIKLICNLIKMLKKMNQKMMIKNKIIKHKFNQKKYNKIFKLKMRINILIMMTKIPIILQTQFKRRIFKIKMI